MSDHPFITHWDARGFFENPALDEEFRVRMGRLQFDIETSLGKLASAANISIALPQPQIDQEPIETSLQELLAPLETDGALVPRGLCCGFAGTLSEARALVGWAVRDGDNGTDDVLGLYARWAADGEDAGGTGGSDTHEHNDHTEQDVIDAIADHAAHNHAYSGTTDDATGCGCCVRNDSSDEEVAVVGHTHAYAGTTGNNSAGKTHVPNAHAPLEHSVGANEPAYHADIPIQKL